MENGEWDGIGKIGERGEDDGQRRERRRERKNASSLPSPLDPGAGARGHRRRAGAFTSRILAADARMNGDNFAFLIIAFYLL